MSPIKGIVQVIWFASKLINSPAPKEVNLKA